MATGLGPELRIDLLGGFRVATDASAVKEGCWRLRKARGLVKLLALAPERSLHREQALEALWPEREPAAAANNLRQALFVARRAFDSCGDNGAARLDLSQDVLTLTSAGLRIDVAEFEAAADQAERERTVDHHRAALGLYRGELLPEDRFEPWTSARREALRERHLALLVDVAILHQHDGDHTAAISALQQALTEEALHERAHRELMRVYALTGRRQRALAQFHLLRESLRSEFEDEPDDETRRLYREILTRTLAVGEAAETSAPGATPGAGSAPRRAGNLPLRLTSFVGRQRELRDVVDLARRHRLVTLTGPGGCGKTRLSLEAATELAAEAADGVWLVELAGLSDDALVAHAIGEVIGVESRSARASEEVVAAHIGDREIRIVLDNCEHLVDRCAQLAEGLLTACPRLTILATSREPLHVAGEVDWRVPSLSPPEAVRLFADRATAVSSRFAISDDNAAAVSEICRRVDGMPLAIELAAARVGVLAPAQIAERLRDSLGVLAAGRRTALTRQQTLTATIDWSHELLGADERELFRRLGVFAGSFDLEAVEDVCAGDLDVLARLVDKSLVMVSEHEAAARYRLLEAVRHYAGDRLTEAGEQQAIEARHRLYYLGVAQALGAAIEEPTVRRRLARENDQLRQALRTALEAEPDLALQLAVALWWFWHDRGDRSEGARWLELALSAAPRDSGSRAAALHGLSVLTLRMGRHQPAVATASEAVALSRAAGDRLALAEELHHLSTLAWVFSDYDAAVAWCEESLAIAEEIGDAGAVASMFHTLGVIAASRNDADAGRELIARSVELLRALAPDGDPLLLPVALGYGHVPGSAHRVFLENTFVTARRVRPAGAVGYALCDLGGVTRNAGDGAGARALFEEALLQFRGIGDEVGTAQALAQLGNRLSAEGEHELARSLHEESLALRMAANDARGIGLSMLAISMAALQAKEFQRATEMSERAHALFDRTGDLPGRGAAIQQLGYIAADMGRPREARELQERALAHWSEFIDRSGWRAPLLLELAELDVGLGEPERAPARLADAMGVAGNVGDRVVMGRCAEALERVNALLTGC